MNRKLKSYTYNGHTVDNIAEVIEDLWGISFTQMKGRSRKRYVCNARAVFLYILVKEMKWPLKDSGKLLDRDHTTVLHVLRTLYTDQEEMIEKTIKVLKQPHTEMCRPVKMQIR